MNLKNSYLGQAWLVLVLALSFGAALAGLHLGLRDRIAANKEADALGAVGDVVPGATQGEPAEPVAAIPVYLARNAKGEHVGWMVKASGAGYSGPIEMLIGLDAQAGRIMGIRILMQTESPGSGSRISEAPFTSQFAGGRLSAEQAVKAVKGSAAGAGEILAISGATVSSESVCAIVNGAVEAVREELAARAATLGGVPAGLDDMTMPQAAPVTRPAVQRPAYPGRAGAAVRVGLHVYRPLYDAADKHTGWLIETDGQGYSGKIRIEFAVDADVERLTGLWVTEQCESSLGPQITEDEFRRPFFSGRLAYNRPVECVPEDLWTPADENQNPDGDPPPAWTPSRHVARVLELLDLLTGNTVPAITGATESCTSVCQIVNKATRQLRTTLKAKTAELREKPAGQVAAANP